MIEPTRLRYDLDEPAELRLDLAAEANLPLGHDLAALKAGLTSGLGTSGAAAGLPWMSGLTWGLVLALGLGAGYLWTQRDGRAPDPLVATFDHQPVVGDVAAPKATRFVAAAPAPDAPPHATLAPAPAQAAAGEPAGAAAAAERPSDLAAQLAQYRAGQAELTAGHFEAAAEAFEAYRTRFPDGDLRAEATLGALEAWHRAEVPDRTVALARELLDDDSFSQRHPEVWRVLAEAEVMRGRCQQARAAFERAAQGGQATDSTELQGALQACERRSTR